MKRQVYLATIVALLLIIEWSVAYHPDFSWKNMDSFMTGDLRHRMTKKIPTRRRYCDCGEVDAEDSYPVCASNGALYENACLFKCAKVRWPHLVEVDLDSCGSHTFKEFSQNEFLPHY